MQNYIKKNKYISQELTIGESLTVEKYHRLWIDEHHPSYQDSKTIFSQSKYKYPYLPLYLGQYNIENIENLNINVLRLLIRMNHENEKIYLPKELLILKDFILENINYHRLYYPKNKNAFVYITVRSCSENHLYYKNSQTWHVDGFQGSKVKKHIVEQNFIWSNKAPTEFLLQPMFCEGLNPSRHDINDFFEKNAIEQNIYRGKEYGLYVINPYNIHRVNKTSFDGKRVFIRLNFSPVEIVDITNTINPNLKRENIPMRDVRDFLNTYTLDEGVMSGFDKINK
jgi:hypothetical protein